MAASLKRNHQGTAFVHALHPVVVQLPVGPWVIALVFDAAGNIFPSHRSMFSAAAVLAIAVGLLIAAVAISISLADGWVIPGEKSAHTPHLWHLGLNAAAFAILLINLLVRWNGDFFGGAIPMGLSAVGAAFVIIAGYVSGRMVFDHGTGVVH